MDNGERRRDNRWMSVATLNYAMDQDRTVTLESIANVNTDDSGIFEPKVIQLRIHPGEVYDRVFVAENLLDRRRTEQASPSVSSGPAALHVFKTECSCFTRQESEPHERREIPLRFVVDAELPEDLAMFSLA